MVSCEVRTGYANSIRKEFSLRFAQTNTRKGRYGQCVPMFKLREPVEVRGLVVNTGIQSRAPVSSALVS
jgi:hypothetical protein